MNFVDFGRKSGKIGFESLTSIPGWGAPIGGGCLVMVISSGSEITDSYCGSGDCDDFYYVESELLGHWKNIVHTCVCTRISRTY